MENLNERDTIFNRVKKIEQDLFPDYDRQLDQLEEVYRKKRREQGANEYSEKARTEYLLKYKEYEKICDEYQDLRRIIAGF